MKSSHETLVLKGHIAESGPYRCNKQFYPLRNLGEGIPPAQHQSPGIQMAQNQSPGTHNFHEPITRNSVNSPAQNQSPEIQKARTKHQEFSDDHHCMWNYKLAWRRTLIVQICSVDLITKNVKLTLPRCCHHRNIVGQQGPNRPLTPLAMFLKENRLLQRATHSELGKPTRGS